MRNICSDRSIFELRCSLDICQRFPEQFKVGSCVGTVCKFYKYLYYVVTEQGPTTELASSWGQHQTAGGGVSMSPQAVCWAASHSELLGASRPFLGGMGQLECATGTRSVSPLAGWLASTTAELHARLRPLLPFLSPLGHLPPIHALCRAGGAKTEALAYNGIAKSFHSGLPSEPDLYSARVPSYVSTELVQELDHHVV